MIPDEEMQALQAHRNVAYVLDAWHRVYLVRLDMPPIPCRRKVSRYEQWLGLALFLPSYLFVLWKLLMG